MHLVKSGKVKDVYAVNDKELEFKFSNRISVFDKIIPSEIPNKGETLARTSAIKSAQAKRPGRAFETGSRFRVAHSALY